MATEGSRMTITVRMANGETYEDDTMSPSEFEELWELAIESGTLIQINLMKNTAYLNPYQVVSMKHESTTDGS